MHTEINWRNLRSVCYINVNVLIVILDYYFARSYHKEELRKMYLESLCIVSCKYRGLLQWSTYCLSVYPCIYWSIHILGSYQHWISDSVSSQLHQHLVLNYLFFFSHLIHRDIPFWVLLFFLAFIWRIIILKIFSCPYLPYVHPFQWSVFWPLSNWLVWFFFFLLLFWVFF